MINMEECQEEAKKAAHKMIEAADGTPPHIHFAALAMTAAASIVALTSKIPREALVTGFVVGMNHYIDALLEQEAVKALVKTLAEDPDVHH